MRVRLKKADLAPATSIVQTVANPQSTLPILSNVLITTEHDNVLSLLATDYETRVKIEVAAEVERKGSITVPAKTFNELVKELPEDGEVIIESKDKSVLVRCRDIRAELQCMPAKDFPALPELDPTVTFDLGQRDLKRLIEKVFFAIPVRDPRKVLLGALFEFRDGILKAIATDGKIMAHASQPVQSEFAPRDLNIVIHHKLLEELKNSLGDEGMVTASFDDKQISFRFNNILLMSNQIEGKYPNYEAVVPKKFGRELRFQRGAMTSAIRRAAILSDIKNASITLVFHGDTCSVEAESYDRGHIEEQIPAVVEGEDFRIVFNYRFVLESIKAIDKEEIVLRVNQSATPAVLCGGEGEDCFYLIMPIKTQELKDLEHEEEPDADDGGYGDEEQ
jgi:DNA polymerase III subunit beta